MKKQLMTGLALLAAVWTASATLYYQGTPGIDTTGGTSMGAVGSTTILDGNPVGTWNTMTLSGLGPVLTGLTVTVNVTGGVNSDLYAYLSHNGEIAVLLNRMGVSPTTPFGDTGSGFIASYTALDANNTVSPFAGAASFTGAGPTTDLTTTFGSVDLNGTWTLFFADVATGGGNATLNGWSLNLTAVPEPVNVALGVFAAMLVVLAGVRAWRTKGA